MLNYAGLPGTNINEHYYASDLRTLKEEIEDNAPVHTVHVALAEAANWYHKFQTHPLTQLP